MPESNQEVDELHVIIHLISRSEQYETGPSGEKIKMKLGMTNATVLFFFFIIIKIIIIIIIVYFYFYFLFF